MNLTAYQQDVLQEVVNIGVGKAAGVLDDMLGTHIRLQIPCIKILLPEQLKDKLEERLDGERVSAVGLGFRGSFAGNAQLVVPTDSASMLVAILTGEEPGSPDLDSVKIGTLSEVGNIVLNGVMGSISNVFEQRLDYSLPSYKEGTVDNLWPSSDFAPHATILLAQTHFTLEQLEISGDIILIFNVGSFDALIKAIDSAVEEAL